MNTVLKSFVIISMLCIALSAQAQSVADKLYTQGQQLQLTRTVSAQKQAIAKFSAAKKAYDSKEKKAMCDRQIQICHKNIKALGKPDSDPKSKPKPKPTPKQDTYPPKVEAISTANGMLFKIGNVSFEMVRVEGGTFTMGATPEQASDAESDEKPTHQVTLSSFMIGKTEVTQALWQAVMGSKPSYFKGSSLPVEQVSWDDCQTFIRKLNALTGKNFRLPTEAEWEFAARGGNNSRGYKYSGSNTLSNVAWYSDNSGITTHPVATKAPNELGIYDMSGNVCEWCSDWKGSYSSSSQYNPIGPNSGSYRVNRGGSWDKYAGNWRVSARSVNSPTDRYENLGLRLALSEDSNRDDGPKVEAINTADGILFKIGNTNFEMVRVQGGTFMMGGTYEQGSDAESDEKPVHFVTLSSYMIGKTEVTQELWETVMGQSITQIASEKELALFGVGPNYPMYDISWNDCQAFIRKLNALTGRNFCLPTEAEWEYAARGGNKRNGYKFSGSNNVDDVAWYKDNSKGIAHCVATKAPNELGIYDMSGNLWELCSDWYGEYIDSVQVNPIGPSSGTNRVARGGCQNNITRGCRVSDRAYASPSGIGNALGLRLCLYENNRQVQDFKPKENSKKDNISNQTFTANGVSFEMVRVEGGTFTMGATPEQGSDADSDEKPSHQVTLSSYYIGKTEVTQVLWEAVMGSNPSCFKGSNLPVEKVSYNDCQTFIRKLNALTGKNFRLPTEAEWEFAARGGNNSQGYKYSGSNTPSNVAWYSDGATHPVASKSPNELGIYDMSGNVYEWCSDYYGGYSSSSQLNPTGPYSGSLRVARGGCCFGNAKHCHVSERNSCDPSQRNINFGLRLVLSEDNNRNNNTKPATQTYTRKVETFYANGVTFDMVRVQGGTFTMGATPEQGSEAYDKEKPTHQVTLSSYMIGKTEVTQALWQAVMGSNPSNFKGSNLPVEMVSWDDCQTFIRKLNALTGKNFRLPTEAEWEFAVRGGNNSRGYKYSGSNTLSDVAWYEDNSSSKTHPVATKAPNELGIYDMSGNVYEWCSDWKDSYSSSSQYNPTGPNSGSYRVYRGGCWYGSARSCRVSYRYYLNPTYRNNYLGLRLAL